MKTCPECGENVGLYARRCACGWQAPAANGAGVDPDRWRCCDVFQGQRCASTGTFAFNGPKEWYCHRHFPPLVGMQGPRTPPPGGFVALRRLLGRVGPLDPESAAERAAIESEPTTL